MKHNMSALTIIGCGFLSTLLCSFLIAWLEEASQVRLTSIMILFVIPIGSFIVGIVSGCGFYIGGIALQAKPSNLVLLASIPVAAAGYFFIQYFHYSRMMVDGAPVSQVLSFFHYWQIQMSHTTLEIFSKGRGSQATKSVVEGGMVGYVLALVQMFGVWIGSVWSVLRLQQKVYCDDCSIFFRRAGDVERYTTRLLGLNFLENLVSAVNRGDFTQAFKIHEDHGGVEDYDEDQHDIRTNLALSICPVCNKYHVGLSVYKATSPKSWRRIHELDSGRIKFSPNSSKSQ